MSDEPILCPWCGSCEVERRGAHWCCVTCQAFWLALNLADLKFLRRLRIAPS